MSIYGRRFDAWFDAHARSRVTRTVAAVVLIVLVAALGVYVANLRG